MKVSEPSQHQRLYMFFVYVCMKWVFQDFCLTFAWSHLMKSAAQSEQSDLLMVTILGEAAEVELQKYEVCVLA